LAGTYDGKPYYRRVDGAWFIWWHINEYLITDILFEESESFWAHPSGPEILGQYNPIGSAVGIATVSAGPQ